MGTVILNVIPDFFVSYLFNPLSSELYFSKFHPLLGHLTVLDRGSSGTCKGSPWN